MGLMDKFKNLFTEEVEDETVVEEPIKKEVIQVEIPSPKTRRSDEVVAPTEEAKEEPKEEKKEEYNFPFFDDEDFSALEPAIPKEKPKKKSSYHKETKEVYSPPKEEKKVFKPTPIISPVYGILDKNYQKEDIKAKNSKFRSYYNPKEATVDEIRNKAYGTLEDDIETTLFGNNKVLFEESEPEEILRENIETDAEVVETINNDDDFNDVVEKPKHGASEEDLTDLLQAELGKEELPRKISDSELFSMIDSMYQKGDKE